MNLGTFLMSAALAMATAPNAVANPVFYTDRSAFEAATPPLSPTISGELIMESFDFVTPVQTIDGFPVLIFPSINTPGFVFSPGDAPVLLDSSNSASLGLNNAITDGSGALTLTTSGGDANIFFTFNANPSITPELSATFNSSITAFGLDITTSGATSNSQLNILFDDFGLPSSTQFFFTTNADSPQFVGVVFPDGFNEVFFQFEEFAAPINVAFDRLSYVIPPMSPASTSEYTLYVYVYADTYIWI